jgi:hypothetical protein
MTERMDYGAHQLGKQIQPCNCGCYCCCVCVIGHDLVASVVIMVGAEAIITTGSFLMPKDPLPPRIGT